MLIKKDKNMKNLDIQTQKKKRGLTLIEALIVLAVFAGVVAGVLALVNNVQRSAAVGEETTNLTTIYGNIDSYFRRGSTNGFDNRDAVIGGMIPGGMLLEGEPAEHIANSFGGYIQIEGSQGVAGNTRGFSVQYNRVPQAACTDFIQGQVRTGWDTVGVAADDDSANDAFSATPDTLFFSSDGGQGNMTRGNTPLTEIAMLGMCDVDTNYVHIIFVKDSDA